MTEATARPRKADNSPNGLAPADAPGMLTGLPVTQFVHETAEYSGLLLAGQGADVVKVEPPGGSPTRRIAPFWEDKPGPERSLYFWAYNRGKRSIIADLDTTAGRE